MSCLAIFSKSHTKLTDASSSHSHNLQGALTTAKHLVLKIHTSRQKFPHKYLPPRGPPFELLTLIAQFSLEITQSAREISGCLKRVSDFMIVDEVLKDLDMVERVFRRRVLDVLRRAAGDKNVVVEWEELIWETRKLRRRALRTLGQK